ncbi:Membrane protein involved in the export of O-antigen and teichoic acid [Devosia sp. YR412]|uniref:oligosaccharide flippase family protein n=1 Tax=Devosia sp. YR412 TaxID=1881030 RepID=UPI0008D51AAD|nr:oligosaccharide flippase family protein [Devosia sp. YR412]SEQ23606.1 Membrane protein involved in the export of O-antigen and teichoic acid [Devosia sp. YR412]
MRIKIPTDLSALLHAGLWRSVVSLGIKVATAGLTYLTYVVLSRTMTPLEYGHFAFGLALATVLAIAAGIGQPMAILRLWSQETVAGRKEEAVAAARDGAGITIAASLIVAVALCVVVTIILQFMTFDDTSNHFYGAAFLILPMALAEYNSSALRAQGSLWTALFPRDILWRVALPGVVLALFAVGVVLSGPDALVLSAALLTGMLGLQLWLAIRKGRYVLMPALTGLRAYWAKWGGISRWLMLGALIETAALNADVILVGLMLDLESSGVYFNAFRTAGLMTLFTFAIELVIAPMVAQHFHAGQMRKAQAITALASGAGFAFSLVIFALFAIWGDFILSLFGPSYAEGTLVLVLLAFGLLFDAATGPSKIVMMMTGHERAYVAIFGTIMGLGFLLQILVIPAFGIVGAAATNMVARIAAQLAIALYCRLRIGLDTSLIGVFAVRGAVDRPAAI